MKIPTRENSKNFSVKFMWVNLFCQTFSVILSGIQT